MLFLYITNARIPTEKANGIQIMENCRALSKMQDVEVSLISSKRVGLKSKNPFKYYNFDKTFEFKRIFSIDLLFFPFAKFATFVLQAVSFTVFSFIYALMNGRDIDLVYTRDFYIAFALSFLEPVFYEVHSLPSAPSVLHKLAWKRSKTLIVISNALRDDLIKFGVPKNKILVARDGVDVDRFNTDITKERARKKLNTYLNTYLNRYLIVYTGHLYSWKGVDTLAQAVEKLSKDTHVFLVGGTDEDVERFREQYSAENLHIVGHRPQAEIPVWLKSADLLVLPNSVKEKISSHYTSPLKLFEYMSSGTPIVASDLPSIREVLNDGDAVFFTADDPNSLSNAIKESFNKYSDLEKQARILAQDAKKYNWENRAKMIINKILESIR